MGYTVCFTGHRSIPEEARASLANELDRVIADLYSLGADTFISGGALGFDLIAACRTARFRAENDGVRLVLALPCGIRPRAGRITIRCVRTRCSFPTRTRFIIRMLSTLRTAC